MDLLPCCAILFLLLLRTRIIRLQKRPLELLNTLWPAAAQLAAATRPALARQHAALALVFIEGAERHGIIVVDLLQRRVKINQRLLIGLGVVEEVTALRIRHLTRPVIKVSLHILRHFLLQPPLLIIFAPPHVSENKRGELEEDWQDIQKHVMQRIVYDFICVNLRPYILVLHVNYQHTRPRHQRQRQPHARKNQ